MNQVLDMKRLGYLARRDFFSGWRSMAIATAAVAGGLFLSVYIGALFGRGSGTDYLSYLTKTLVIWGSISASLAFTSLHDKTKNEAYLLLPASATEKTLVRLLATSVATPLYIIIMISLASLLSEAVKTLLLKTPFAPLNPFQGTVLKTWGGVVIFQSVFFLGAAWFKKAHFLKTVLAIIILFIALGITGSVLFRIFIGPIFRELSSSGTMNLNQDFNSLINTRLSLLMNTLEIIGKVFLYGILAPLCWFLAWLRVKGTQSSDGV